MVMLCRSLGWRYEDYIAQPAWFIDLMEMMLAEEGKRQDKTK